MIEKRCCNCKNFEATEEQSFTDTQTGKIYSVEDFDEIINLLNNKDKRITELERIEQKRKKDNVEWALNQFRYKEKTEDEQKAFCIIESILNTNW